MHIPPTWLLVFTVVSGRLMTGVQAEETKAFRYTSAMKRAEADLRALEYIKDKVERISVPVSKSLIVEKVPITLIKAHVEHAGHVTAAWGYPSSKKSELPAKVIGLTEYWLVPLTVTAEKEALEQRPRLDLIRADAKLFAGLLEQFGEKDVSPDKILAELEDVDIPTNRLLPINPPGGGNAINFSPVPLIWLLKRFDPKSDVTKETADVVAEEILWTKELGISDGTYQTLPQAREVVQAAILEGLNFDIGNPSHKDKSKSAKAKAKLEEGKKSLINTWRLAAKKQ